MNNNPFYNRDTDILNLFRDYIHFSSAEQTTLNNLLHTQNLLSNNRYSMYNHMFRFISPEITPLMPPPTFNSSPNPLFTHNHRIRSNRRPMRSPFSTRRPATTPLTTNHLQEFIHAANDNRRRPTTMRQFFDNCHVFTYTRDLSNNQDVCPITMQAFNDGEPCVKLPCNHIFKFRPLFQWLSTARTCPICRQRINSLTRHDTGGQDASNPPIDLTTDNVSVQTTDISNGFIADVSANNMEDLSAALTQTLSNSINNLLNTLDLSNNNLPTLFTTNISLVAPRNFAQSPINDILAAMDSSGNTYAEYND